MLNELLIEELTSLCLLFRIALLEISNLLNTGLDSETLSICVKLCEAGVNPEALAAVIKELKRESLALQVTERNYIQDSLGSSPHV